MSRVLYFVVGMDASVEIPSIRATVLKISAICVATSQRYLSISNKMSVVLSGGRLIPQYKW